MLFAPVFHGRVTRPAAASSRSAGVAPIQCLTPTFLGPSACSLLSDVQTSLIFFFPEPQPACHPSLCGSSTSPPPSIGHLLKQGFQKKITYRIQYPTPIVGHLLISRCQMCPVCASIFKIWFQLLARTSPPLPSLTISLIHQIIDIQHHLKWMLAKIVVTFKGPGPLGGGVSFLKIYIFCLSVPVSS